MDDSKKSDVWIKEVPARKAPFYCSVTKPRIKDVSGPANTSVK